MATKTQNSKLRTQNSLLIGVDSRDPQNTRVFVFNGKKWSIKKISLKQQTAGSQLLAVLEKKFFPSLRLSAYVSTKAEGSAQQALLFKSVNVQNSRTRILHTTKNLKLVVINGYGERFSSLRLGVIIANALSLAKEIPLYGATLPAREFDLNKIKTALLKALKTKPKVQKPLYASAPNISALTKGQT